MAGSKRATAKEPQKPEAKPRISRWAADGLSAFEDAAGAEAAEEVKKTCADFVAWASELHQDSPRGTVPFLRKMIEAYELTGKTAACFATREFLDWVSTCLGLFQTYFLEVKEGSTDHLYTARREAEEESEAETVEEAPMKNERAPRGDSGAKIYQWSTLGMEAFERQPDSDLQRANDVFDDFKSWMINDNKKSPHAANESVRHVSRLFYGHGRSFAAMSSDEFSEWCKDIGPDGEPNVNRYAKNAVRLFQIFSRDVLKEPTDHLYRAGPREDSARESAKAATEPKRERAASEVKSEKTASEPKAEKAAAEPKSEKVEPKSEKEAAAAAEDAGPKEAAAKTLISQWGTWGLDVFENATVADDKEFAVIIEEFRTWLVGPLQKTERSVKDHYAMVTRAYHRLGKSIACFCTDELIEWGRAETVPGIGQYNLPRHTTGCMRTFQTFLLEEKKWDASHLYVAAPKADAANGGATASPETSAPASVKRKAQSAGEDSHKKPRAEDSGAAQEEEAALEEDLADGTAQAEVRAATPAVGNGAAKPRILQWETLGIEAFKEATPEEEKEFTDVMAAYRTWCVDIMGKSLSTATTYSRALERTFPALGRAIVCYATDELHTWGKGTDDTGMQRIQNNSLYAMRAFQTFYREQSYAASRLDDLYKTV